MSGARGGACTRRRELPPWCPRLLKTRAALRDQIALDEDLYCADVQLLGAAVPPPVKSYPKTGPTVLFAMGFGAISGVMLALFRPGSSILKVSAYLEPIAFNPKHIPR